MLLLKMVIKREFCR